MQKAATPADQSILRDYLSPIPFSTMWMSFRSKDFAVLLSTLGSLLLQLTVSITSKRNGTGRSLFLDYCVHGPYYARIYVGGESGGGEFVE